MITNAIVFGSLALALVYFIVWLLRHDFRDQIEQPKHNFQVQVERYDRQLAGQENQKLHEEDMRQTG